jgi:hypothetical protein
VIRKFFYVLLALTQYRLAYWVSLRMVGLVRRRASSLGAKPAYQPSNDSFSAKRLKRATTGVRILR